MKNLILILSTAALIFTSCSGKNSYEFEAFYNEKGSNGDSSVVSKKDRIVAGSDSAAFVEAQEKFKTLMNNSGDEAGMPERFTLRNSEGMIVTQPGQQKTREVEKPMYPNQKP